MNRRPLVLFVGAVALACGPNEPDDQQAGKPEVASPSLEIEFYVQPLVNIPEAGAGPDTLWSPNDDRDSVLVVLRGADERETATVSTALVVEEIDLTDRSPSPSRRTLEGLVASAVNLGGLQSEYGGRLILVIEPREMGKTIRLAQTEAIVGVIVSVKLADGSSTSARITLLPGI